MAYESYHRTARKEYACDKCGFPILPGDYYEWYRYTGGGYGLNNPSRFHTEPTCEAAKKREEEKRKKENGSREQEMKAVNPCIFCGRELRAVYPYYKILRQENSWVRPRTVGRICEDCLEKGKKENVSRGQEGPI